MIKKIICVVLCLPSMAVVTAPQKTKKRSAQTRNTNNNNVVRVAIRASNGTAKSASVVNRTKHPLQFKWYKTETTTSIDDMGTETESTNLVVLQAVAVQANATTRINAPADSDGASVMAVGTPPSARCTNVGCTQFTAQANEFDANTSATVVIPESKLFIGNFKAF